MVDGVQLIRPQLPFIFFRKEKKNGLCINSNRFFNFIFRKNIYSPLK
jgi:hypothetical protein